jgi:hypothetical protein
MVGFDVAKVESKDIVIKISHNGFTSKVTVVEDKQWTKWMAYDCTIPATIPFHHVPCIETPTLQL